MQVLKIWLITGAKEEEGLEEGVRQQMEDCGDVGTDAQGGDHETQLADRGISQNPLDVILRHGDRGRCRVQST